MSNENSSAPANFPSGEGSDPHGAGGSKRQIVPRSAEEIQNWFQSYVAEALQRPAENIELTVPFETLGLDSVTAVGMSGDLETWLGLSIDPMVIYDYPTIESLAEFLAECSRTGRAAT